MPRNKSFPSTHDPLRHHLSLTHSPSHTTGPFSFLNPTGAHILHETPSQDPSSPYRFHWRSRDNRKGRHALLVPSDTPSSSHSSPTPTSKPQAIAHQLLSMLTRYPYWDISYLVAIIFTLGSMIWVINAFFVWLPLVRPSTEFAGEISTGGGWTAFVGATVFEVGSVLLMLEAVNENREGCFGWALERAVDGWRAEIGGVEGCAHHHGNRGNLVGRGAKAGGDGVGGGENGDGKGGRGRAWQWYPSWKDLTGHYVFELGFLACSAQMFGATVFWISGFTAIPQIFDRLITQQAVDGAYWVPQIIGGCGFIVSGMLFMIETQEKWYKPAFGVLGWHIGFWNLIGAFGFTLCGALGPAYANTGAQFEASLATFWGSWAFLIGSVVQWYESLVKYPVETYRVSSGSGKGEVPQDNEQKQAVDESGY